MNGGDRGLVGNSGGRNTRKGKGARRNTDEDWHALEEYMNATNEPRIAFSRTEYADRMRKVREEMDRRKIDVMLLSAPESQCWLHGYQARWYRTGSTTNWPPVNYTVVSADGDMFVIDTPDHERLVEFTSIATFVETTSADPGLHSMNAALVEFLDHERLLEGKFGIEMWSPRQNAAVTADLISKLTSAFVTVEDVTISMRNLQLLKSEAEIEKMDEAGSILDSAYAHLVDGVPKLSRFATEIEVWAELEYAMAKRGGESAGLHNTVARTRNYYHALSTRRTLGAGQIHLDPSSVVDRYHVNTARQFFIRDSDQNILLPRIVSDASKVAADAVDIVLAEATIGESFASVSEKLRKHYIDSGFWDYRDWIGGYQLGISFTPDWVGQFIWNVDKADEDNAPLMRDPGDPDDPGEKIVGEGLVTNFESYVGGAGLIDTIVFSKHGNRTFSKRDRGIGLL
jgi:Xaa-Pro aminopeptidase